MDKKIFQIKSLHESEDYNFWRNKTYLERIETLETLRRNVFGYDPLTDRLQRVLTITQLKED